VEDLGLTVPQLHGGVSGRITASSLMQCRSIPLSRFALVWETILCRGLVGRARPIPRLLALGNSLESMTGLRTRITSRQAGSFAVRPKLIRCWFSVGGR